MGPIELWLTFLCIGVITYAIRLSFILLFEKMVIPSFLMRALRFVPLAVLSAIILPALFLDGSRLDLSLGNARLLAGSIAAVVAWRTKNALLTIVVGMVGLWVLHIL
ncbi:MAG TPA: AzlD domain-containing protein [Ktedonobacteraceae bacterium]|jgi:branched chain amino acid efflux pump|nr:AzlD domain-containing protein [Ktedonobacteraceae bacterium]